MSKTITVKQGDCFLNLSRQAGFAWETLWEHPENSQLRQLRKNPNIIKPGDEVFIPDLKVKTIPRPTDQKHRFVRKDQPAKFELTLTDMDIPRSKEEYVLIVDGQHRRGTTDSKGTLRESIPPGAVEGLLLLGPNQERFTIQFGFVDPIGEISGVKSRLRNLGHYDGDIDDELTAESSAAIAEFKRTVNLPGEGELDADTRAALVKAHRS
jgi:hypothetical protein